MGWAVDDALQPSSQRLTGNGKDFAAGLTSNYITSPYSYSGVRGDGATLYTAPSGNVYARESNHWDITYYSCGGC